MTRYKTATLSAVFGFVGATVVILLSIFRSTSSTAAIGIIFIPFYAAPVTLVFYIFGYSLPDLIIWSKGKTAEISILMKLRAILAVLLLISGISYVTYGVVLTITVQQAKGLDESGISEFLESAIFKDNKFALGALANNPNTQTAVLAQIAQMPNLELHRKMWTIWPVIEGKGLAVMRLVAMHKNVSKEILVTLSKSPDEYVLNTVAGNAKTPAPIIRQFFEKGGYLMEWGVAANDNAPADILMKLALSNNQYTRGAVARNSNTPVETLAFLAKDTVWHVRGNIALNPHTNAEALEKLSSDTNSDVRRYVSMNLNASVKTLEGFSNDPEILIRNNAKRTLKKKEITK